MCIEHLEVLIISRFAVWHNIFYGKGFRYDQMYEIKS